jgi:hypothetical protein
VVVKLGQENEKPEACRVRIFRNMTISLTDPFKLYQELVNQAGNIQSISGELDGSNKAIMQALISEGYSPQQAALMTPAAASRASAGFGAQSFDPSTGILTSTRNP